MATFVGTCNVDYYSQCDRLPEIGETLVGNHLMRGMGGKGANACVQCALLSDEPPTLISAVGNDPNGRETLQYFSNCGLNTKCINIRNESLTGTALCFVLKGGESAIVIHPCLISLDWLEHCREDIRKSRVVVTNFETGVDVATAAMKMGYEAGATTVLNAAPIPPNLDREIFKYSKIVIVNEVEMKALGEKDALFEAGVQVVVLTLGAEGAAVYQRGKDEIRVPSARVKAVDTTGAGDSFVGSFAFCLMKGKNYEEAARFACATAAYSVQKPGTQQSYTNKENRELMTLLN